MQLQGQARFMEFATPAAWIRVVFEEPGALRSTSFSSRPLSYFMYGSLHDPVKNLEPTPCQGSAMHLQPSSPIQRALGPEQCMPHVSPVCEVPG